MEVAYSQGEIEVEALGYRVGVAVFDACGIGGLALVALGSELEIVGEEIAVDAEVVALQGLGLGEGSEILSDFQAAAVDAPVAMLGVLAPPGEHAACA